MLSPVWLRWQRYKSASIKLEAPLLFVVCAFPIPRSHPSLGTGNIVTNPAAGIQFLDFTTGDSLQLTGHAEIVFEDNLLPG